MADVFLMGLDEKSQRWLMQEEGTDTIVPLVPERERSVLLDSRDLSLLAQPAGRKGLQLFLFVQEENDGYALGRMQADLPIAQMLQLGAAEEQRFRLDSDGSSSMLYGSSIYESGHIFLFKMRFRRDDPSWKPFIILIGVRKEDPSQLCYSAVLDSRQPDSAAALMAPPLMAAETDEADQPPRDLALRGDESKVWGQFQRHLFSKDRVQFEKQGTIFSHYRGERTPLLAKWGAFEMAVSHNEAELARRRALVLESMFAKLAVSDATPLLLTDNMEVTDTARGTPDAGCDLDILDGLDEFVSPENSVNMTGSDGHDDGNGIARNACPHCGGTFERKYDRDRHVRTVHMQEKNFKCDSCGKQFSQRSHLKTHVESVHEHRKESKCTHCGMLFSTKYKLQRHVRCVHMRERPFMCVHCGASYFQRSDLVRHEQRRHNAADADPVAAS